MAIRHKFICYPSKNISRTFKCFIDAINLSLETNKISVIFDTSLESYFAYLDKLRYLLQYDYEDDCVCVFYGKRKVLEIYKLEGKIK